jgi:hypothetical protein
MALLKRKVPLLCVRPNASRRVASVKRTLLNNIDFKDGDCIVVQVWGKYGRSPNYSFLIKEKN